MKENRLFYSVVKYIFVTRYLAHIKSLKDVITGCGRLGKTIEVTDECRLYITKDIVLSSEKSTNVSL